MPQTVPRVRYGFPNPKEWFSHRYKGMKEAGMELDSYEEEYALAMNMLKDICKEVCEAWPEGSAMVGAGGFGASATERPHLTICSGLGRTGEDHRLMLS